MTEQQPKPHEQPEQELHIPDGMSSHLVPRIGVVETRHGAPHWGKEAETLTPEEQGAIIDDFYKRIAEQGGEVITMVPITGFRVLGSGSRVPETRLHVSVKKQSGGTGFGYEPARPVPGEI